MVKSASGRHFLRAGEKVSKGKSSRDALLYFFFNKINKVINKEIPTIIFVTQVAL